MIYKLCWIAKDKSFQGIGPVLGKVEKETFIPLSKEQALKRARRFSKDYGRATYFLAEALFVSKDLEELRQLHPSFSEALDLERPDKPQVPLCFYSVGGTELIDNPLDFSSLKKESFLEGEEGEEEDWDLESDLEDDQAFLILEKRVEESLKPRFK
jgi:hypothetical protein